MLPLLAASASATADHPRIGLALKGAGTRSFAIRLRARSSACGAGSDRTFLIEQSAGVEPAEREINLFPALVQGQRLDLALRRYALPAHEGRGFYGLPAPFWAIAADIETGEVVALGHEDLAQAVRASMAVPAVFAPVEYDGRLLVDRGLAMNLPIDGASAGLRCR